MVGEQKSFHRFDMKTEDEGEWADCTTLKESADGESLIFLSNYRTLIFDSHTLQHLHNFNHRVLDILGSSVALLDYNGICISELSKLD